MMRVSLIVINCSDVTDVQVPLGYRPELYHAVTCTSDHLLVAVREPLPAAIAIHSWAGQQSQVITWQQLGLETGENFIHAVSYSQMSRTLHVAAGSQWGACLSAISAPARWVSVRRLSIRGGIRTGSGNGHVLPYISLAIKASSLKFNMCNIYKTTISEMFLVFF